MTCYGGNGEGLRIVYSTSTHQELFDYTIKAFNTAWKYRFPTFVLGDGYQAKMRESLYIYDPAEKGIQMVPTTPFIGLEGTPGIDRKPQQLRNTYNTEEELNEVVNRLMAEYEKVVPEVVEYQTFNTEDSEVVIVAHGVVTRAAQAAVKELRVKGIKAGHFRPVTLRPFAAKELKEIAGRAKKVIIAESSQGQMERLVKDAIYGIDTPLENYFKPGQGITSEELVEFVTKGM
jgi:2-oxoglutarate ferredoxin oxidoreductase subunit alpha